MGGGRDVNETRNKNMRRGERGRGKVGVEGGGVKEPGTKWRPQYVWSVMKRLCHAIVRKQKALLKLTCLTSLFGTLDIL